MRRHMYNCKIQRMYIYEFFYIITLNNIQSYNKYYKVTKERKLLNKPLYSINKFSIHIPNKKNCKLSACNCNRNNRSTKL